MNFSNTTQHQQLGFDFIHHQAEGITIDQRTGDGYINATALCKAANRTWSEYRRNSSTVAFLAELEADTKISVGTLIISVVGGRSMPQGTWVHPLVAVNLGQWLSAKFAVQVSKWVADWMSSQLRPQAPAALPPHLKRYMANDSRVPPGHFSILQETALGLIGPLHQLGFDIPQGWVPDISVGLKFCAWLRDKHGVNTKLLTTYPHDYLDGRPIVQANAYPDQYLAMYRTWFREVWLPENGRSYFRKKDPVSVEYLNKIPALAAPAAAPRLK